MILKKISNFITIIKKREIARYKKKGIKNTIIAFILLFIIIYGGTYVGQKIWPENIQSPEYFTLVVSLLIHIICQFVYFLIFLPGYKGSQLYKPYQINKTQKKPWQKQQTWPDMKTRTIFYLFLNKGVVYPMMLFLSMKFSKVRTRFHDFPSALQVFFHLLIIMYIQDFFFYFYHKLSHLIPFLYKFHKIHHQYQIVFSLAAQFTHPIDYLFGVLIPSAIPFIILSTNTHCFMLFFWQIWKIYISSEGHSGYEIEISPTRVLPFVSGASYHDFHHSKNIGNYAGSVYLWDTVFEENTLYWEMFIKKCQQQVDKQKKINVQKDK